MDNIADILKLDDKERDLFKRSVNAFFTGSFIIRGLESDSKLYRFVISNYKLFESYFDCAGWSLNKDENLGVISWQGAPAARLNLNLEETLSLLVFRLLYEEKRNDISLHEYPSIHLLDFQEMYKIVTDRLLKKTRLGEIVRRFQTLKLIKNIGEDVNPESVIILYPTLAFALDGQSIDDMYSRIDNLKKTNNPENNEFDLNVNQAGDEDNAFTE